MIDPNDIPIRGYVSSDKPVKNPPNTPVPLVPETAKAQYDEDGIKATALSVKEKTDAELKEADLADAQYKAEHPFAAHIANNWYKYALSGAGAIGVLLLKHC